MAVEPDDSLDLEQRDLLALRRLSFDETLFAAALRFRRLQDGRLRPVGRYDNARRFYLGTKRLCCENIRSPSRNFPSSQLVHGRSACHVAHDHGIPGRRAEVVRLANLMNKYPLLERGAEVVRSLLSSNVANEVLAAIDAHSQQQRAMDEPPGL